MIDEAGGRLGWPPCHHPACNRQGPAALALANARHCHKCGRRSTHVEYVVHFRDGGLLCARNARAVCDACAASEPEGAPSDA
jgi:hypothetical protein